MNPPRFDILDWNALAPEARRAALARPRPDRGDLSGGVSDIVARVRNGGDTALTELTAKLDGVRPDMLEVPPERMKEAWDALDPDLAAAIDDAAERIRRFHAADRPVDRQVETAPGVMCRVVYLPLNTVGLYVPGGSAPLVSTVLMLAVPAELAGCSEVVLCSPPGRDGDIGPEILAAAWRCGVDRVFRAGGAQAVAAMAYGTETVPRCDKIFGPGNAWVTEAKQQVSLDPQGAAIDMPAGPSEVMVIADDSATDDDGATLVAWDLMSQAEHGADSQVVLVTDSRRLAQAVIDRLGELVPASRRAGILAESLRSARIILVADPDAALAIVDDYAPEHLIINTRDAAKQAERVRHAGSVFIGRWTPESLGDYCSGTNHVLPTYGWARAHGALGLGDYLRRMTLQEASAEGLARLGPTAETLAAVEGLEAHRMAVTARLNAIGDAT
ncbi:histidinol dehydrogenase [Elongatibacter sediminis]|uniref:Histidinol dehydrogenase n=1 Tax=Elongatibacter sediminis TaxID=3119006 RepID=A0AAW9RGM3_9GAMM